MEIHKISDQPSILNNYLAEIRDKEIQKDSMRFRKNIERIGNILCYEMSRSLHFSAQSVKTPLGSKDVRLISDKIVICSILRAGLTLHYGVLNFFDKAENAFISAFRKHHADDPSQFEIIVEYIACPDLTGKTLLLIDPMLASGKSFELAYRSLLNYGQPDALHLISLVGSRPGVEHLSAVLPQESHLWVADIDNDLNDYAYIVPGLGDAGDLAFGTKLQH